MASTGQTGSLQDQAQGMLNDTKESARAYAGEQQRAAAGGLAQFASALRRAARETADGGQPNQVGRFAESAAEGLERLSSSLGQKDLNRLVGDIESFARNQPIAFFGAAVAAGFLAVRFLKASAPAGAAASASANAPRWPHPNLPQSSSEERKPWQQ